MCYRTFVFAVLLLCGVLCMGNRAAWGDCTPPSKGSHGVYEMSLIPSGTYPGYPSNCGLAPPYNNYVMLQFAYTSGYGGPQESRWDGCAQYRKCWQDAEVDPPNNYRCHIFNAAGLYADPSSTDTDCDTVFDSGDSEPLNNACPGNTSEPRYRLTMSARVTSNGHVYKEYTDTLGTCGTVYVTNFTTAELEALRSGQTSGMTLEIGSSDHLYSYAESTTEEGQGGIGSGSSRVPAESAGESSAIVSELQRISSKVSVTNAKQDSIIETLEGMRGNGSLGGIEGKLDSIKTSIDNKNLEVDVSGIESRLDGTNSRLTDIRDNMVTMGSGELPDGPLTQIQDVSELSEQANQERLEGVRTLMTELFDWFLSSNPFAAVISDIHIEASGSSSVNFNWGKYGGSSGDGGIYEGFLDLLGLAMVAMATIRGVMSVLQT